jgi:hypothetical protein
MRTVAETSNRPVKTNHLFGFVPARIGVPILALALGSFMALAADKPVSSTPGAAATNAVTPEVVIPLSIFNVTNQPTKDPFFPLSTRSPFPSTTSTNAAAPVFTPAIFVLRGLTGLPGSRLALINNNTFADGETGEVTTEKGKFKIKCLKISDVSATIRVPGHNDPIEIFLPNGAR